MCLVVDGLAVPGVRDDLQAVDAKTTGTTQRNNEVNDHRRSRWVFVKAGRCCPDRALFCRDVVDVQAFLTLSVDLISENEINIVGTVEI